MAVSNSSSQVENVRLVDRVSSKKAALGTLYLTATHVIFVENAPDTRKETWVCTPSFGLYIIWSEVWFSTVWFGPRVRWVGFWCLGIHRTVLGMWSLPFSVQSRIYISLFIVNPNYVAIIKGRPVNSQRYKWFLSQLLSRDSKCQYARYSHCILLSPLFW